MGGSCGQFQDVGFNGSTEVNYRVKKFVRRVIDVTGGQTDSSVAGTLKSSCHY